MRLHDGRGALHSTFWAHAIETSQNKPMLGPGGKVPWSVHVHTSPPAIDVCVMNCLCVYEHLLYRRLELITNIHVLTNVCMYAGMHVCVWMQEYIHTYIHAYIRMYIQANVHACMQTYITKMHNIHASIHAWRIHAYDRACMHAYMHTYVHRYVHTYVRK